MSAALVMRAALLALALAPGLTALGGLGVALAQTPIDEVPVDEAPVDEVPVEGDEIEVLGDVTGRYPLEPPDTSSPRATLRTFLTDAREAWTIFFSEQESRRKRHGSAGRRLRRATRCLDLSGLTTGTHSDVANRTAVMLLDVLERVQMPLWSEIPDREQAEAEGLTRWRIPHTNIELHRIEAGPRAGEFLFAPATVNRAEDFYLLTRHLEPRAKAVVQDGYAVYQTLPGWMIPLRSLQRLPSWMRESVAGQAVWQWLALLFPLALAFGILALVQRWARRSARDDKLRSRLRRMALPLISIALSYVLRDLWVDQIGVGATITASKLLLSGAMILATTWLSLQAGGVVSEIILRSPAINAQSVDASMVRIATRLGSLVLAVFVLFEGARHMGVPVMGLVAGLGVGGLAVALAAQSTIENFIGSLTIFADRPVRVGEFCRFGNEVGTVEQIGLRSTRIRTLGRSVITIPNAEFSRTQLDNFSHRDSNLFRARVALRYETTHAQLRDVLERLRSLLHEHRRVKVDPARVRLEEFGEHAFEIQIFAYVDETDWNAYLAIREELLLLITDAVEAAGARLAVPAQTTYLVPGAAPQTGRG